ncbi:hypothetical protein EDD27_3437 [Nonomuraea polychroma]|uniref:Uncharacterized protein n=1 Tax=Nonomuraea polychroma TaxID=46176 RepID=A0A438M557_9ACTN|nr:hypothetical protein EDD27_3437 [Nonomuraea polychroma]
MADEALDLGQISFSDWHVHMDKMTAERFDQQWDVAPRQAARMQETGHRRRGQGAVERAGRGLANHGTWGEAGPPSRGPRHKQDHPDTGRREHGAEGEDEGERALARQRRRDHRVRAEHRDDGRRLREREGMDVRAYSVCEELWSSVCTRWTIFHSPFTLRNVSV